MCTTDASTAMTYFGQFTAKERDAETGLDWMKSRYFSEAQGRFTSPVRQRTHIDQEP